MKQLDKFYINGKWVDPIRSTSMDIINPADETVVGQLAMGSSEDVDAAVKAARDAFETFSESTREERLALMDRIIEIYKRRMEEMAKAISTEMGAPMSMARDSQAPIGLTHFMTARKALETYSFTESKGKTEVIKEPVGVCGFITPWNWPMNQIACKVAPAIACGCTMLLKPSEMAPLSAQLFAEIMDEAGVPAGVFNMVYGDGPEVGAAMSAHPDIDLMSLTGSTRAGVAVAKASADTVKRVALELGGKSPNVILEDADFEKAVKTGAIECFRNTGQSCNAPTRMLVPVKLHDKAVEIAAGVAAKTKVGNPESEDTHIGPLSNKNQFEKVNRMVQDAIDQGTTLAAGGPGRPEGLDKGYFAKPTVFANVTNDMMIAREEVFGPVLAILPYETEEDAIRIANDTPYGLAAYVQTGDIDKARKFSKKIRSGNVFLNGNNFDPNAPFGGYKQSGIGREWGDYAFHDFLEIKGVVGYNA